MDVVKGLEKKQGTIALFSDDVMLAHIGWLQTNDGHASK